MGEAYHAGLGRAVRYQFEPMPEHQDGQVRVAICKMVAYILEDSQDTLIRERAAAILSEFGDPILGVWKHIKWSMRFRQDSEIAAELEIADARLADVVEVFIRPVDQELIIRTNGFGFEDCDGFELYAAALLVALGIPCSLVTIAADSKEPYRYSHVYLAAYPDGQRIPLDFSHGPMPGVEAPHLGRIREWPIRPNDGLSVVWGAAVVMALVAAMLIMRIAQ